jgi:hypothetical protein
MFKSVVLNQQFFASRFCRVKIDERGSFFTALSISLNADNVQNTSGTMQVEETANMMKRWLLREEEWELYRRHIKLDDEQHTFDHVLQPDYSVNSVMLAFVSKRIGISLMIVANGNAPLAYTLDDYLPLSTLVILFAKTCINDQVYYGPILQMNEAHSKNLKAALNKALMGVTPTQSARTRQVSDVLQSQRLGVMMRADPIVTRLLSHAQVRSSDASLFAASS